MPALVAGIHPRIKSGDRLTPRLLIDVDRRDKPGDDELMEVFLCDLCASVVDFRMLPTRA